MMKMIIDEEAGGGGDKGDEPEVTRASRVEVCAPASAASTWPAVLVVSFKQWPCLLVGPVTQTSRA